MQITVAALAWTLVWTATCLAAVKPDGFDEKALWSVVSSRGIPGVVPVTRTLAHCRHTNAIACFTLSLYPFVIDIALNKQRPSNMTGVFEVPGSMNSQPIATANEIMHGALDHGGLEKRLKFRACSTSVSNFAEASIHAADRNEATARVWVPKPRASG